MLDTLLHKVGLGPPPKPKDPSARDPHWQAWVKEFLKGKVCEGCGTPDDLEGHHVIPFHVNPTLELDPANVIPLCMKPGHWCHFVFGHRWNWKNYVTHLRHILAWWRAQGEFVKGGK